MTENYNGTFSKEFYDEVVKAEKLLGDCIVPINFGIVNNTQVVDLGSNVDQQTIIKAVNIILEVFGIGVDIRGRTFNLGEPII